MLRILSKAIFTGGKHLRVARMMSSQPNKVTLYPQWDLAVSERPLSGPSKFIDIVTRTQSVSDVGLMGTLKKSDTTTFSICSPDNKYYQMIKEKYPEKIKNYQRKESYPFQDTLTVDASIAGDVIKILTDLDYEHIVQVPQYIWDAIEETNKSLDTLKKMDY